MTDESRPKRAPRRPPWWAWTGAALAVAAVAALLALPGGGSRWRFEMIKGAGDLQVNGQAVGPEALAAAVTGLRSGGADVSLPYNVAVDLSLPDRLTVELAEGAQVTLPAPPRPRGRPQPYELRRGELRFITAGGAGGHPLLVRTPEGVTQITPDAGGAIVSVYRPGGMTCVCVVKGAVRVGASTTDLEEVPAGRRKVMYADGRPPLMAGIEPDHQRGLERLLAQQRPAPRAGGE